MQVGQLWWNLGEFREEHIQICGSLTQCGDSFQNQCVGGGPAAQTTTFPWSRKEQVCSAAEVDRAAWWEVLVPGEAQQKWNEARLL